MIPELEDSDNIIREAIGMGVEAKEFLNSNLASHIRAAAQLKTQEAYRQLAKVDPVDTAEIIRLQKIIGIFDHYETCLRELVTAGDSAYQLYLEQNTND